MNNYVQMIMSICALSFSFFFEKIRQKDQLLTEWGLIMCFLPEHALIWNCPHTPGSARKLRNVIVIVFYIYSAFHNAINHLFIIYGLDAMDKSLQSGSFEVCTLSRNGVVCLKLVYSCRYFGTRRLGAATVPPGGV